MSAVSTKRQISKAPLGIFLSQNPYPCPWTLGFFYREKMRAIHRIAPEQIEDPIAEVGGGESGLTALLYPKARIVNVDIDSRLAKAAPNRGGEMNFVCGDAARLPLRDGDFGAVTMFDLIEHVQRDDSVASEALRILRPGGVLLLSTPHLRWCYPFYSVYRRFCPTEDELFKLWGHVRRGYDENALSVLFGAKPEAKAAFINRLTVVSHDISFSRLSHRARVLACALLWPLTFTGYLMSGLPGTEIAARWTKAAATGVLKFPSHASASRRFASP